MQRTSVTALTFMLLGALALVPLFGQSNRGEVQIYVFGQDGTPLEGVETEGNGEVYASDADGLLNFTHPAGTHQFELTYDGSTIATVEVPIRQGRTTEVIITAREDEEQAAEVERLEQQEQSEAEALSSQERQAIDPDAPTGTIRGEITHIESGEAVAQATVIFRNVDFETTTDENGTFLAELPRGEYSFSVIHPDFSTQQMDNVQVTVDETSEIAMELTPSAIELDAVTVFAAEEIRVQGGIANLIEETRNSSVVMNMIGQEQLSRTGDADAASALRRVTGLTIVDGRFVYVRGMGERYSVSYLNGTRLPSPEIDKRVVPLDLFPTDVVESLAIQKSYSPDLIGDFGGGAVNIRSLGIPDDRYRRRLRTTITGSVAYNPGTSLTERLVENGGNLDWLGIDDGTRELPGAIPDEPLTTGGTLDQGNVTEEELEKIAESFPDTLEPDKRTIPLDYSGSISVRDKIELSETRSFGFSSSLSYSNSWDYRERSRRTYERAGDGGNRVTSDYDSEITSRDIDVGGLLDLVYNHSDQLSIESTSLLIRATDSVVDQYQGYYQPDAVYLGITEQYWVEQMLLHQAFEGTAGLNFWNGSELNWIYALSLAQRNEPDHRLVGYQNKGDADEFTEDNKILYSRPTLNARWYNTVDDLIHDASVGMSIPTFLFNENAPDFLDFGFSGMYQTREADTRRFNYNYTEVDPALELDPDELFTEEYIGELLDFTERTLETDNYTASHLLLGSYLSGDFLLLGDLRMDLGTRVEYSNQEVITSDFFTGEELAPATLETVDILPAVNFTLPTGDRTQLRLSGSRTVNRPDLRELSEAVKFGAPGQPELRGNSDLNRAIIYSGDLRFEGYLAERENYSIGGFYKYFEDPIEAIQLYGANPVLTYANIPSAYNVGGELEWQLQLRFLSDLMRNWMLNLHFDSLERERRWRRRLGSLSSFFRDLRSTGNVSLIYSRVNYGEVEQGVALTTTERPLQGQSPYVVNLSLGYENSVSWSQDRPMYTSVFLNYNVSGPRIISLGTGGVPNTYEQPFHQLDLVIKQQFTHVFHLGFKAQNLLNLPAEETLGEDGEIVQSFRKGRSFSISATLDL